MTDKGIDYGMGATNIDHETGIRYGVIPHSAIVQAWSDSSEPNYVYNCPYCGAELGLDVNSCPACGEELLADDFDNIEPSSLVYDREGYHADQSFDDTDIFITKSPYYTYAQLCGPCAPGAGYLLEPVDMDPNNMTYCFGHDWFESAPEGEKPCAKCNHGILAKNRIFEYNEEYFVENHGIVFNATHVQCWTCNGTGTVTNWVSRAPYPVYSVETGEKIEP